MTGWSVAGAFADAKRTQFQHGADPSFLAAARELRDRWPEGVNKAGYSLETHGKHDVTRPTSADWVAWRRKFGQNLRPMAKTDPDVPFIINKIEPWTIVEFRTASLMDPIVLEKTGQALYHLVDAEDRRLIIMDFSNVQYISSQAIGIVLTMNKKLTALKRSKFVLCGVGDKLMQLIKITRLDRLLTIKPSQEEAVKIQMIL